MGLDHIEAGAFCNLHHLLRLNLQDNKLQTPLELCELKCCIDTLILSGNNLTNLGKNFFEGYKQLRHINLNNNKLVVLPDLHWIKHSLKTMLAYSNNMKSLEEFEITSVFESLLYMDTGGNRIHTFNVTILRHMPKLHTLLLYGNKLTYINNFRIHYKKAIDLRGNPWHYLGWASTTWRFKMAWLARRLLACRESPLLIWVNMISHRINLLYIFRFHNQIASFKHFLYYHSDKSKTNQNVTSIKMMTSNIRVWMKSFCSRIALLNTDALVQYCFKTCDKNRWFVNCSAIYICI